MRFQEILPMSSSGQSPKGQPSTGLPSNGLPLDGLRRALQADRTFTRVQAEAARSFSVRSEDYQISAPAGLRPVLLAEMADGLLNAAENDGAAADHTVPGVVLAVTATGREAEDLAAALRAYLPANAVAEFPSWETLPHERLSPRSDTVGRRLSVLRRLAHPEDAPTRETQANPETQPSRKTQRATSAWWWPPSGPWSSRWWPAWANWFR
jgi:transcription-repair coupling factor (superfamily II helicase)